MATRRRERSERQRLVYIDSRYTCTYLEVMQKGMYIHMYSILYRAQAADLSTNRNKVLDM